MSSTNDAAISHLSNSLYMHLVSFTRENQEYQPLLASWELEQPQYINWLENVVHSFPTYTRHDHLHAAHVVSNIEMILGDDRIQCLGPTDTWLLLQCAYSHDTGMVITETQIKEAIETGELQKHVNSLRQKGGEYARAAHAFDIGRLERQLTNNDTSRWIDPLETQRSVMMVLSSFFRSSHGMNSKQHIETELDERTYHGIFARRVRRLVGDINRVHTTDWTELMQLKEETDGFGRDYAHPRFVASLLRLGDLLDVDNNRLNPYQISIARQPSDAKSHLWKHRALEHIRISPQCIELDFDFNIEEPPTADLLPIEEKRRVLRDACKLARECYTSLYCELEQLALHWQEIAPTGFPGSAPLLRESRIRLDGQELSSEDFDLRYEISHLRACEIIQGAGLYDEPLTFLRELIQNAVDATKVRAFEDLCSGVYGEFPTHCPSTDLSPQDLMPLLSPYIDSLGIRVEIEIQIDTSKDKCYPRSLSGVKVRVVDQGTGISRKKLHKMKHIGNIYDAQYEKNVAQMPPWFRPTGSFGIGLQSVFQYADTFEMNTFSREENKKLNIQFFSTKLGGEIICLYDNDSERRFLPGTEVTVYIEDDLFPWEELTQQLRQEDQSDAFSVGDSTRLAYAKQYLRSQLREDVFPIFARFCVRDKFKNTVQYEKEQDKIPFVQSLFVKYWKESLHDFERTTDDLFDIDWPTLSFSQWSSKNKIAAHCSLLFASEHSISGQKHDERIESHHLPLTGRTQISYRGMQVLDVKHSDHLRYPLSNVDAYLLFGDAKTILRTSRDGFLDEMVSLIREKVNDTVFQGISNLLLQYWNNLQLPHDDSDRVLSKQYKDWKVIHETKLSGKQAFVLALATKERISVCERHPRERSGELTAYKNLLNVLIAKLSKTTIPARVITSEASMEEKRYCAASLFDENVRHWFTQSLFHGTRVELIHMGDATSRQASSITYTHDFFSGLSTEFFWSNAFFIRRRGEHPVPIYTYGNLPREHIELSMNDIAMLFTYAYSELVEDRHEQQTLFGDRPVFPSLPHFELLAVGNEFGIYTKHLENCGAYIIAPFNRTITMKYMQRDKLINDEYVEEAISNILCDHTIPPLVHYVIEHSVYSHHSSYKNIEYAYSSFLRYFIDIVRRENMLPHNADSLNDQM